MSCRSSLFLTYCPPMRQRYTAGEPPVGYFYANPLATCFQTEGVHAWLNFAVFLNTMGESESKVKWWLEKKKINLLVVLLFLHFPLYCEMVSCSSPWIPCCFLVLWRGLFFPLGLKSMIIMTEQIVSNLNWIQFSLLIRCNETKSPQKL